MNTPLIFHEIPLYPILPPTTQVWHIYQKPFRKERSRGHEPSPPASSPPAASGWSSAFLEETLQLRDWGETSYFYRVFVTHIRLYVHSMCAKLNVSRCPDLASLDLLPLLLDSTPASKAQCLGVCSHLLSQLLVCQAWLFHVKFQPIQIMFLKRNHQAILHRLHQTPEYLPPKKNNQ